jgi:uncharacterized protein Usg
MRSKISWFGILVMGLFLTGCGDIDTSISVSSLTGTWTNSDYPSHSLIFTSEKTVTVRGYGISLSSWSYSLDDETITISDGKDSYTGTIKLKDNTLTLSGFTDFWARDLNGTWKKNE